METLLLILVAACAVLLVGILVMGNMIANRLDGIIELLKPTTYERLMNLAHRRKQCRNSITKKYEGAAEQLSKRYDIEKDDIVEKIPKYAPIHTSLKGTIDTNEVKPVLDMTYFGKGAVFDTETSKNVIINFMGERHDFKILVSALMLTSENKHVEGVLEVLSTTNSTITVYNDVSVAHLEEILEYVRTKTHIRIDNILSSTDSIIIKELCEYDFIFTPHSGIRSAFEVFHSVFQQIYQ